MPELNDDTQNTEEQEQGSKKKSKLLLWIGLGIGSFIIVFIATFFWIVYVQKPNLSADTTTAMPSDSLAQQAIQKDSVLAQQQPKPDPVETAEQTAIATATPGSENLAAGTTNSDNRAEASIVEPPTTLEKTPELPKEEPADYRQLAKIYSQMDVKAAADILSRLNTKMVVGILGEMRDRNAAQILMAFNRDKAARLSQALSEQHAGS